MTWATDRLEALKAGEATLPPVVEQLMMGGLDDWGPGWARKTWTPSPQVVNGDGTLFGGYLAALADQILAFAAMSLVPADQVFRTANLSVNFIRVTPPRPLLIEGRVIARTRQLMTVRATFAREDGELIAEAGAQQILLPAPAGLTAA